MFEDKICGSDFVTFKKLINSSWFGNFLIILVRVFNQVKRQNATAYSFLICQLAIADFLFAFTLLFDVSFFFKSTGWDIGQGWCKFIKMLQSTSLSTTTFFLMVMAYERYLGISNPLKHRWSIKRTSFIVAGVWGFIALTMVPFFFALGISDKNECLDMSYPSKIFSKGYTIFLFVANYIIPLLMISIFHTMIVKELNLQLKSIARYVHRDVEACIERENSTCMESVSTSRWSGCSSKLSDRNEKIVFNNSQTFNTHQIQEQIHKITDSSFVVSQKTKEYHSNSKKEAFESLITKDFTLRKHSNKKSKKNIFILKKLPRDNKRYAISSIFKWFLNVSSKKKILNDNKVIRMLLAVTLCFSLMTLPTQIWYILNEFADSTIFKRRLIKLLGVLSNLAYFHCCTNCIIYSIMAKKFRKDVSFLFATICRRKNRFANSI